MNLQPFYKLHRRTYGVYWDVFTPEEWHVQQAGYAEEAERTRRLEAATVSYIQPGETIFEREFNYQGGDDATAARMLGRPGRRAQSWFSYDLPVEPVHPMTLIATYYSDDRRGTPADFEILVDGQVLSGQVIRLSDPPRFFDVEYPLSAGMVDGKNQVTVRLQARAGSRIATVFGLRMIRGDALR